MVGFPVDIGANLYQTMQIISIVRLHKIADTPMPTFVDFYLYAKSSLKEKPLYKLV